MQNVSNDWKSVQNQQLVNESYIEISFSIADPDAIADASAKDNGADIALFGHTHEPLCEYA